MSGTGIYLGNIDYWLHSKGGFFPYGVKGMFSGASTLIFAYVGYEVVASATEEAVNPQRCVEEVSALIFAVNEPFLKTHSLLREVLRNLMDLYFLPK